MRYLIFLLAVLLMAGCADKESKGDLIMVPAGDLLLGSQTLTNANGLGIDFEFSFSGDITSDGMVTYAGTNIGGLGNTRFGWTAAINSGVFQTQTSLFRIDALNGTFDGFVGSEKQFSNSSDNLFMRSDGVWDVTGSPIWTIVGDTVVANPTSSYAYVSGTSTASTFVPEITGGTFLEVYSTETLKFAGTYNQPFDFNLTNATVSGIPEPSSGLLFGSIVVPMLLKRRKQPVKQLGIAKIQKHKKQNE